MVGRIRKCLYMFLMSSAVLLSAAPGSHAALMTLPNEPVEFSAPVQPNIFFMLDDSGSMSWEDLLNEGTQFPGGAIFSNSVSGGNPPDSTGLSSDLKRGLRRLFCRGFNVMGYDPNQTYVPWEGVDGAGNPYTDQSLASARTDPYNPGSTVNISNHIYFPWTDADSDGKYDGPGSSPWYAPADAGVNNGGTDECGDVSSDANGVAVNTLSAAQQTNYANWFSYYRRRDHVLKRAVSAVIKPSTAHMGLATIHDNNSVGTPVDDVDDISLPINATAKAHKEDLLEAVSRIQSSGATPLRRGLENAGIYYDSSAPSDLGFTNVSPILPANQGGACQQNFTILMTDGFWNGGDPGVGNADGDNNTTFDGSPYGDTQSETLADVAMKYYETDLSGLSNSVPDDPDPTNAPVVTADHQRMVTFTVGFGVFGSLDPATADPTAGTFTWPAVTTSAGRIDDLFHAAYNARGTYVSASDPQQLVQAINDAIDDIGQRVGSASAIGASSTSLSTDTQLFQALFDSTRWTGDVIGFSFPFGTSITEDWRAATELDSKGPTSRRIVTFDHDAATPGATPFQWNDLNTTQKDDLRTNSAGGTDSDTVAKARLAFLRGDRECERDGNASTSCTYDNDGDGSTTDADEIFRARGDPAAGGAGGRLGDIIHSTPAYVGAPIPFYYPDEDPFGAAGERYVDYETAQANRPGVVYVGANDGMLHAFVAKNGALGAGGEELFAYVPGTLYDDTTGRGLHKLTETTYDHRFYVDLSPAVTPAYLTAGVGMDWKTVLVGGLRSGGQGYFAIDVTDPAGIGSETDVASRVMWEFTDRDTDAGAVVNGDADLGYSFSEAVIALVRDGNNNYQWVAIFGNGYNNSEADGSASGTGHAVLFIVDLETGDLVRKIDTEVGSTGTPNGLNTPSVADIDLDGVADIVYAGDLQGNLWKFDLRATNQGSWDVAYKQGANKLPLFQAVDDTTTKTPQPITTRPFTTFHPEGEGGLVVYFGTGKLITTADKTTTGTQTFYGVWDKDEASLTKFDKDDLLEQTLSTTTVGGETVVLNSDNPMTWRTGAAAPGNYMGWYIDLSAFAAQGGERVINDPVVLGPYVFFSSVIPSIDQCDAGGDSVLYVVDSNDGGAPLLASFDLNNDGDLTADDAVTQGGVKVNPVGMKKKGVATDSTFVGNRRITAGVGQGTPGGGLSPSAKCPPGSECALRQALPGAGRVSWRGLEIE